MKAKPEKKHLPSQPSLVQNKTLIIALDKILKPLPKSETGNKNSKERILISAIVALILFGTYLVVDSSSNKILITDEGDEYIQPSRMPASYIPPQVNGSNSEETLPTGNYQNSNSVSGPTFIDGPTQPQYYPSSDIIFYQEDAYTQNDYQQEYLAEEHEPLY